jgi:hypothetical protein
MLRLQILLLAFVTSFSLLAQEVTFKNLVSTGQVQVDGSGFKKGSQKFQANFYKQVEGSNKEQFLKTIPVNQNGSFSYKTPANTFKHKDDIILKVLQFKGEGKHFVETWEFRKPQPKPKPAPVSGIDGSKIPEYAKQQANTVANRVADTYGKRENFRYNITRGFHNAYTSYSGSSDFYNQGYREGKRQSTSSARQAGINAANNQGGDAAKALVRRRFSDATNRGTRPSSSVIVNIPNFNGLTPSLKTPSAKSELAELKSRFNSSYRGYSYDRDGFLVKNDGHSIDDIYAAQGNYKFVTSWFAADYAYTEWKENRLGGGYDYNLYRKMTSDQKNRFAREFKRVYGLRIDEKYHRVKTQRNDVAYDLGRQYGELVAMKVSKKQGYNAGYTEIYKAASKEAFRSKYRSSFQYTFDREFDRYNNNAIIEINDIALSGSFLPGGMIGIVLKSARNIGGKRFSGNVSLTGEHLGAIGSKKLTIEALSKVNNKSFLDIAKISANVPYGKNIGVTFKAGNGQKGAQFNISYTAIIKGYLADNSSSVLSSYIFKRLASEFDKAKAKDYKDGANSLLQKTIKIVRGQNNASNFAPLAQKLLDHSSTADEGGFWNRGPGKKKERFQTLVQSLL